MTTTDTTRSTIVDPELFGTHLTAVQIGEVIRHGHWIPVSRGITKRYVETNHPGWTFNALIAVFNEAGVRNGNRCKESVASLHFDGPEHWLIEWTDGTTTCSKQVAR